MQKSLFVRQLILSLLFYFVSTVALATNVDCRFLTAQLIENEQMVKASSNTVMNLNRRLGKYEKDFGPVFNQVLSYATDRTVYWMDLGAGNAYAQRDALLMKKFPYLHAISVGHNPPNDKDFSTDFFKIAETLGRDHYKYYSGGFFHQLPIQNYEAKMDLITDYFGVLSYTDNFSRDLNLALSKLKIGGKLIFIMTSPKSSLSIKNQSGDSVNAEEYFSAIQGAKLDEIELLPGYLHRFTLQKTEQETQTPELKLKSIVSGTPPERSFILTDKILGSAQP